MAASRQAIQSRALGTTFSAAGVASDNNDMECTALMMAQDSAAIQILLEAMHLYITSDTESKDHFEPPKGTSSKDVINSGEKVTLPKGMVNESIANIGMFIHRITLLLHS
jgi:hypothetical protein